MSQLQSKTKNLEKRKPKNLSNRYLIYDFNNIQIHKAQISKKRTAFCRAAYIQTFSYEEIEKNQIENYIKNRQTGNEKFQKRK